MNIKNFLKKSIENKISVEKQTEFLSEKEDLTPSELKDAVDFLTEKMPLKLDFRIGMDICGTGGSGLKRINTSTISAFILAALGVKIAKHGNKAASGRFGSFDLIESLGIDFEKTEKMYETENLSFLYARKFHPIMKHFAAVRQKIGKPTFFNIIGPLLNPGFINMQIIGTAFKDKMDLIAETCRLLNRTRVMVVYGEDGLDEVTLTGKTFITELYRGKIKKYDISPEDFGVKKCGLKEIEGGGKKENTALAIQILKGKCQSRHEDLVLINSALALYLYGKVKTLKEGYKMAKNALKSGLAYEKFRKIIDLCEKSELLLDILEQTQKDVNYRKNFELYEEYICDKSYSKYRDFKKSLQKEGLSIIAEIKRKSPSSGMMKKNYHPGEIAIIYEKNCVDAISVLTESKYFAGDIKHLDSAFINTKRTPILRKDFIIDKYQVYEARHFGASAVLLIASILSEKELKNFIQAAKKAGMDALVEIHNEKDLKKALNADAEIIGINNRDLNSLKIDLNTTKKLAKIIPKGKIIVSESGFKNEEDIKKLPENIDAILVGTSLMKAKNIPKTINCLRGKKAVTKICGIRSLTEAKYCKKIGVEFIGLNFVPESHRYITEEQAEIICKNIKKCKKAGVFQNEKIEKVNYLAKKLNLDFIQLSGDESADYIKKCIRPVIKTVSPENEYDVLKAADLLPITAYIIFDGKKPGSGKNFNYEMLKDFRGFYLLAGGINIKNIPKILKNIHPYGFDIASGVETGKKIDLKKNHEIHKKLHTQ